MLKILKEQFNRIIQCFIYTLLMCLIYGIWTWSVWHLWVVTLLIVVTIVVAGAIVGYFWIKSQIKSETTVENN